MAKQKIMYATDYSDAANYALHFACSLARDLDAELLIVHVTDHELMPVGEAFCDDEPQPSPQETKELEAVKPYDSSLACEYRLIYGPPTSQNIHPAEELIKAADNEQVYAIILGTHGRSGIGHALLGSFAEKVIRHANCPVVTIRLPK
jgi:nucleotide-binding universal stress UspA family protein